MAATPFISMSTQGCRGFCPIYTLDFRNNGSVTYEGTQFVEKTGKIEFQLTPEELKQLQAKVQQVNLWQYPEHIESRVADAPYVTLKAYDGQKVHAVSGSIDRPKPIMELEMYMKDLAETHGIVVKKGVNPNDPIKKLTAQIIVKLKPEINSGNWIGNFGAEIPLRLIRRVSSDNNWLVAYDPKQFTETEIIDLMKSMEGVLDAVPGKQ